MPYHATPKDHGPTFTFDRGGHYEQVENGAPQQMVASGEFVGWQVSSTPELAASLSPEAAAFAQIKNLAEGSGNTATSPTTLQIYQLDATPDVDLTNAVMGDFALIEEVRYRNPSSTPIVGDRLHSIRLPSRVLGDVDLTYLPPGPHIISEWGTQVKRAIRRVIDGDQYPEDVATWAGVEAPNIEAYYPSP